MGAETHCVVKERVNNLIERKKNLEAEVARLTGENEKQYLRIAALEKENKRLKGDQIEIEFSENDTSKLFGDMNETIARLTGENEKLRDDLGLTMSEERKLRTENAEQRARISELERLKAEAKTKDDEGLRKGLEEIVAGIDEACSMVEEKEGQDSLTLKVANICREQIKKLLTNTPNVEVFTTDCPPGECWKPNSLEEVGERAEAAAKRVKELYGTGQTNAKPPDFKS